MNKKERQFFTEGLKKVIDIDTKPFLNSISKGKLEGKLTKRDYIMFQSGFNIGLFVSIAKSLVPDGKLK